jgi:hypothetical protein
MGRWHTFAKVTVFILFNLFLVSGISEGFNDEAHKALSERAILPGVPNASQLDNFLKTTLGFEFPGGINQPLLGGEDGTVVGLIKLGAVREDYPASRVLNHFHDPTRQWDVAGYTGFWGDGLSSIVWSQLSFQQVGITRTWKIARDSYLDALTSTTDSERKGWYAETFRTLGHLIHHVQDAATPTHARNDSHVAPFKHSEWPDGDPFHFWADRAAGIARINSSEPLRFNPSLLNQASSNQDAPIPIARIIDSTDGDIGSDALIPPGLNIGLAEYSNANFISKGTSRSTKYQSPHPSQLQFGGVETGSDGKIVRYARFQPGIGEQDYRVGRTSRMVFFANATNVFGALDLGLDDNVHDDYGRKLFPRAIGYSAGLIDYFFRGRISSDDSTVFINLPPSPASSPPTSIGLQVLNASNEETGSGTMVVILTFFGTFGEPTNETFPPIIVSNPVPVTLTRSFQDVTFQFGALPFPSEVLVSSFYDATLVYSGLLGEEDGAVVVSIACPGFDFNHGVDFFGNEIVWVGSNCQS